MVIQRLMRFGIRDAGGYGNAEVQVPFFLQRHR
jgi:hypothetical protein